MSYTTIVLLSEINKIHKLEKGIVSLLNFDGWALEWSGGHFAHYDARGITPKGTDCVIEMKFRNKYYNEKLLEQYKYDKLMKMDINIVKLYFINDPKGNYMFWLNELELPKIKDMWCPNTSFWDTKKVLKPCYLIPENEAVWINYND